MFEDQSSFAIIKPVRMNTTLQPGSIAAASGARTSASAAGVGREFEALISGCGIFDLSSRAKIRLTGSDRARWLNGMVTNNIRDLALNRGVYCFLLNAQGHIQADLYAYNMGESLLVDVAGDCARRCWRISTSSSSWTMWKWRCNFEDGCDWVERAAGEGVLRAAGIDLPELAPLELCTPNAIAIVDAWRARSCEAMKR